MDSRAALTVFFAFYVVFFCLDVLPEAAAMTRITQSGHAGLLLARLAAAALVPAVVATLALAPLLLYAHVRELGRATAAGARLVSRLATATLVVAVVALLSAAAVVSLGGADDVGWLSVE